ncbi:MAG: radical SAM protein [Bacteroidales bacterium]|nr:radical SAM protein [Bacteroidales bacterium]
MKNNNAPFNLQDYMSNGVRHLMATAYRSALSNPREARFVLQMQNRFRRAEQLRRSNKNAGLDVPPFLICSIATQCNLHCKGCYARSNGIASDNTRSAAATLSPDQWRDIFRQAEALGVNFALLAGGEPLMRRDVLEAVADVKGIVYPIFTNGTLIGPSYVQFFRKHLNLIPVISIEGNGSETDDRRGAGVYRRTMLSMDLLREERLFFGASITVTTENYKLVTDPAFVRRLQQKGCRILFYVEYVPTDAGTEHLALTDQHVAEMEATVNGLRTTIDDMIILSFPGDEKGMEGCLAAGRGFFHIGPDGSAEPCPFSPFSDSNVVKMGLRDAMQSPLFRKIRNANALGWEHTGGCTLFEHREEVAAMLQKN